MNSRLKNTLPFGLTILATILDQMTKYFIVASIPENTQRWSFLGGFFRIIHQKNLGAAFSMGSTLTDIPRLLFFIVLPLGVLAAVVVFYFTAKDLRYSQKWLLAGILGGGLGNMIDRIFRPGGVVDFLSVKFYGLFGLDYFPTFNVADSFVTVCGILFVLIYIINDRQNKDAERKTDGQ